MQKLEIKFIIYRPKVQGNEDGMSLRMYMDSPDGAICITSLNYPPNRRLAQLSLWGCYKSVNYAGLV